MKKEKKPFKASTVKTMDGFANFTAGMGVGADNVLSAGGYNQNLITKNRMLLENIYRGSWIGGKVIDDFAVDMTRAGITINSCDDPETTKTIQRSMVKMQIWTSLCQLIKYGRLYGGAIGVYQIDGQLLETPLNVETVGKGQFKGLAIYDRWQIEPDLTRLIQSGPDIGLPEFYRIVTGWKGTAAQAYTGYIHYTRTIRTIGIQLPYWQAQQESMWGESILERLYDRLLSYDTATLGVSNLIQRAHLRQVGVKGLRDVLAMGGKAEENMLKMFGMVRTLQVSEGLTILDADDTMTYNSYTFAGLPDVLIQFGQQISGACGIPLVRLFGQSPAGMSATGESDLRNYYDSINGQQENSLREPVDTILSLIYRSSYGKPRPSDMDFIFKSLWQTSAVERATIAKTIAEAVDMALASGAIDQPTAARELAQSSHDTGIFTNITAEILAEMDSEPPAPMVENLPVTE